MFDDVFDDKQWKAARDKTGQKGSLTEKVSMGDEFKLFQKNKSVATAKVLQKKLELYEKQLKDKHSKEKYYSKLLKVVQDQKSAIQAGVQAAENPPPTTTNTPPKPSPEELERDRQKIREMEEKAQREREYEAKSTDPNAPVFGEPRRVYLRLTNEFKTIEGKIKAHHNAATELLQKCKTLASTSNLQAKPEVALTVAEKILEALNKVEIKASDVQSAFEYEAVRKEQGGQGRSVRVLDGLAAQLTQAMVEVAKTGRECRLALKGALQPLIGNNPKVQQFIARLHV
jgi:hypothetical protein